MINLLKLFSVTAVMAIGIAHAANKTYSDSQSNGQYALEQTCKVTVDHGGDDMAKSEYNATLYNKDGQVIGSTTYEVSVGAFCYDYFKSIDDNLFKALG